MCLDGENGGASETISHIVYTSSDTHQNPQPQTSPLACDPEGRSCTLSPTHLGRWLGLCAEVALLSHRSPPSLFLAQFALRGTPGSSPDALAVSERLTEVITVLLNIGTPVDQDIIF